MGREQEKTLAKVRSYSSEFVKLISKVNSLEIVSVAEIIHDSMKRRRSIYVCGNGGSAALSQHFAIDLGLGTSKYLNAHGCRVFDLTSNAAILTATANDIDFTEVFSRQIELYGQSRDLLIAISSSGNSLNVVKAITKARELGIETIGITGFDGGQLKKIVDYHIHVESKIGDYGKVEDVHSFILHLVTNLVRGFSEE